MNHRPAHLRSRPQWRLGQRTQRVLRRMERAMQLELERVVQRLVPRDGKKLN